MIPPSARYVPDWLSDSMWVTLLVQWLDMQPWETAGRDRRVQQYGWKYDYKARSVSDSSYIGPLPDIITPLAMNLKLQGHFSNIPTQVIVNEYLPGQGIGRHVDSHVFGPEIATLSLLSPIEMEFNSLGGLDDMRHTLEPNSLLVLANDSRYHWTHGIKQRKQDNGIKRERRISVTFRTLAA